MIDGFDRHGLTILQAWGMTETRTARDDLPPAARPARVAGRRTHPLPRTPGRAACRSSRCASATTRARTCPGTTRRWASSRSAARGSPPATTATRATDKFTADGWFAHRRRRRRSTSAAASASATAPRTSSSPAASGSARSTSRTRSWPTRPSPRPRSSRSETTAGASARSRSSRSARAPAADADELREHLAADFAKWQLPERFEYVDAIPRTATGKWKKTALRERFIDNVTA